VTRHQLLRRPSKVAIVTDNCILYINLIIVLFWCTVVPQHYVVLMLILLMSLARKVEMSFRSTVLLTCFGIKRVLHGYFMRWMPIQLSIVSFIVMISRQKVPIIRPLDTMRRGVTDTERPIICFWALVDSLAPESSHADIVFTMIPLRTSWSTYVRLAS
jgi:hypothetical protein